MYIDQEAYYFCYKKYVYQKECAKLEKDFGEQTTPKAETMHEKLQRYQEKADRQNSNRPYQNRDKGAR